MIGIRKNEGITLIALIITIIIMLILLAVTVAIAFGENGLIERAKKAGDRWKEEQERELALGDDNDWEKWIGGEIGEVTPPTGEVTYSTTEPTSNPVIATMETSKEIVTPNGWTRVDSTHYTREYTMNVTETLIITDLFGKEGTVEIEINNIETTMPTGMASYNPDTLTAGSVTVTIKTNKPVNTPSGWTFVTNQEFTKVYTENKTENITITDFASNTGTVNVAVTNILTGSEINTPKVVTGMTPIKWVDDLVTPTTTSDPEWYDYIAQTTGTASGGTSKWANVRLLDGSMLVWIPRYAYKIESGYHTSTAGTIDIKFLSGTSNNFLDGTGTAETTATYGTGANVNKQTNYIVHPAFNFGGVELTGIWIGKFESSNNGGKVQIVPKVTSWRNIDVSTMFNESQKIAKTNYATYGFASSGAVDTHMMKNTEWGAVAYLAHSKYGRNGTEVRNNNNSGYITGIAGDSVSAAPSTSTTNAYNTATGKLASTTGNYYGIYDMSGGAWEYVMGALSTSTTGETPTVVDSGFSTIPNAKYYDLYQRGAQESQMKNYAANSSKKGDAVYETSSSGSGATSWNGDYSDFVGSSAPWFLRGGRCNDSSYAGLFHFSPSTGAANIYCSFRVVCAP